MDVGETLKNRAALYCRVSTEDQAKEGFSLSAQKERLKAYCKAKGWPVVNSYIDDGYSGRYSDRPAYQKMFEDKDTWDILVVMKMDRIHRNSKNFTLMMENLNAWDKEFTSMQESFDTTTAMGRFVMDIIQRIAQLESEQIGERVYVGMEQKAKQGVGILGFNIPYGFDNEGDNLVINNEEADIVLYMYTCYGEGDTLRDISAKLKELEIRTKKGHDRWDPKTIQRILSNPIYIGYLHWENIFYRGGFDPIVSEELFIKIHDRLHRKDSEVLVHLRSRGLISSKT